MRFTLRLIFSAAAAGGGSMGRPPPGERTGSACIRFTTALSTPPKRPPRISRTLPSSLHSAALNTSQLTPFMSHASAWSTVLPQSASSNSVAAVMRLLAPE
jgi:hypothetical protein